MEKWPFFGGLLIAMAAAFKIIRWIAKLLQYLMVIGTFVVLVCYILHELGLPFPNLIPFLPAIGVSSGN